MDNSINTVKMPMLTHPRIIKDVLTYYSTTFSALKELINNSIQAQATQIKIDLIPSECDQDSIQYHPIESIKIFDNGQGIPFSLFQESFMKIATDTKVGGLGVGRFGALQIGGYVTILTTGYDEIKKCYTTTSLSLNASIINSRRLEEETFDVKYLESKEPLSTGCSLTISSLHHNSGGKIYKRQKLSNEFSDSNSFCQAIFEAYPFIIFERKVTFIINGQQIDREDYCVGEPIHRTINFVSASGTEKKINVTFYNVKLKTKDISIFFQINEAGLMSSIARYQYVSPWHTPDLGSWYVTVDSDIITRDMVSNFELADLGERDSKIVQEALKNCIDDFFKETNAKYNNFLDRLTKDKSYPYEANINRSTNLEQNIFNQAAYLIELDQKILEKNNPARKTIYPLLKKIIENGDVEFLVNEVIQLSDDSRERFRSLLDATDLDDVISFSSSVAKNAQFLNFLHELCYGEISKWLKERKQLHKIVEKNLWIFGEEYGGSTRLWSDQRLENNLYKLHTKYFSYIPTKDDDNLIELAKEEDKDITDLFFYNKKKLGNGREEVMIVELKAPSCAISDKEILQIEKYRNDILTSSAYPKDRVCYKIILISSKITKSAKIKLQGTQSYDSDIDPFLYSHYEAEGADIKLYVMEWSELIALNKRKLAYLSTSLDVREENVNEKFMREYPQLIDEKSRNRLNKRELR